MRVLAVKRISRDTESSSALERQGLELSEAIVKGSHTVAGWVEDVTVSGAVDLDQRPSLGKWLRVPLVHEWDALMVTTQDRISRDDMHWWSFIHWVLSNEKNILVLDDPSFDVSTPNGRMIAGIKAAQAANYRNSVKEKKLNQTKHYRDENLWGGGTWPFGYRAAVFTHNGTSRWRLEIDPVTGPLVQEAYDRIVNKDESLGSIAKDWNARGILTAFDHMRSVNAQEGRIGVKTNVKGTKWATSTMTAVFTKKSIMGYAMHRGEPIIRHGLPVVWADPLLTEDEWEKLQEVMDKRARGKGGPKRTATYLAGVAFCRCGEPLYSNTSRRKLKDGTVREYSYYLCRSWGRKDGTRCEWVTSWQKSLIEELLTERLLAEAGELEITTRTFVPGVDKSREIRQITEALDNLTGNLAILKPGSAAALAVIRSMEEHERALETLKAIPVIPARWIEEGTGVTYRQQWERADWAARGELLRKAGIFILMGGTSKEPVVWLHMPDDLTQRAANLHTGHVPTGSEEWQEGLGKAAEQLSGRDTETHARSA
ncbi:recombinase family protein [Streptomyces sasae]|uniref:recombinase family protein n=1 Tax=Streptomyces sasae TaxID=1266772 RepID=UPI00292E6231|nr:recombinase family protein [Streptomyces sasae]